MLSSNESLMVDFATITNEVEYRLCTPKAEPLQYTVLTGTGQSLAMLAEHPIRSLNIQFRHRKTP